MHTVSENVDSLRCSEVCFASFCDGHTAVGCLMQLTLPSTAAVKHCCYQHYKHQTSTHQAATLTQEINTY
eukprot:12469-Heterococcus_DN1.PRE.2